MRRVISYLIMAFILTVIMVVYLRSVYVSPLSGQTYMEIEPGDSARVVVRKLVGERSVHFGVALSAMLINGSYKYLKTGEYQFPQGFSIEEMIEAITKAQFRVAYKFAVIEGMTVAQVTQKLMEQKQLSGQVTSVPYEGFLFPDTYSVYKGDHRQVLLNTMSQKMQKVLQHIWQERDESIPLNSPEELLTLASIVEKETDVDHERPMIAGVFINRLKSNIMLQSDPTVIYALSQGVGPLGRELTRRDLQVQLPHNTYVYKGLPPTPIAIPSLRSLMAAARPAKTKALYFVATGYGGHVFSDTLQQHALHHQKLRKLRRKNLTSN